MSDILSLKELSKNISVLYVEDDDIIRKKTHKLLSRIFSKIDLASNGVEGISSYMKFHHDLIISDIVMDKMDGIEMLKLIKKVQNDQSIIFLSAYTEQKFFVEAIELGVDAFVFKPIDTQKLYDMIEKAVKHILLKKENLEYKQHLENLVEKRTNDLNRKNKELQKMIIEVKKVNHLKEEMALAQKVQENFLPKKILTNKKIDIATYFQSATYVGGDYYDLFYSKDGTVNMIIADVSGHGLAPAITMSTFRGICRAILDLNLEFKEQISLINNHLCKDSKISEFFITAVFIKFYEDSNLIEYISAGHNDILFFNKKNDQIQRLKSTSIPLAIFENIEYKIERKDIKKDDFLLLYTDGLVEAQNSSKKMYSLEKLIFIADKSKNLAAKAILENIVNSLEEFIKEEETKDDTTILITKFTQ